MNGEAPIPAGPLRSKLSPLTPSLRLLRFDKSAPDTSEPNPPSDPVLRFGEAELRPASRELLLKGHPASLGARAFDILAVLAQRHGRVVSKRELMSLVWPDTVVEEANLRVNMVAIRKCLGPQIISTIPGRGYQFAQQVIHTTAPRSSPETPASVGTDSPPGVTMLIGREELLAQALSLLQQRRLLTLTGLSGSGKTSLAHAIKAALSDDPRTRVVWVDLGPLTDSASVAGSIARCCELDVGSADGLRGLVKALRHDAWTLVLDNAEHLVDSVAEVAHALLQNCSRLQLLVTSQARLKLAVETVLPVPPLPVAPVGTPVAQALRAPAQALFLARCAAMGRQLPSDQLTLDRIATLCERLDGLPLALEYAAAAVPMLGLHGVLQALDDRRLSLSAGRRDAPPRHASLRALLQWSVALLGPNERTVLRRLGAFSGGCSLELFRGVVAGDFEDHWTALEALSELIDRSLVVSEAAEPPRYRLLETTRAFAMEQLCAHQEAHAFRARLAGAVCQRQERLHRAAQAGEVPIAEAMAQLLEEIDNTQSAWQWAMEHDSALALRLCMPLCYVLGRSGGWTESTRYFVQTARHFKESQPLALRARWACEAGRHLSMHDWPRAREWLCLALDAYRELDDRQGLCQAVAAWGHWLLQGHTDPPAWREALHELRALDDESWPDAVRAPGVVIAAKLDMALHGRAAARAALEQALALSGCDPLARTYLLINMMQAALQDDSAPEVIALAEPLLPALRQGRHHTALSFVLLCLVQAQLRGGRTAEARQTFGDGLPVAHAHDLLYLWGDALAAWACTLGAFDEAAWLNGYSDSGHRTRGIERNEAEAWFRRESERLTRAALTEAAYRHAYRQGERSDDDASLALPTRLLQRG